MSRKKDRMLVVCSGQAGAGSHKRFVVAVFQRDEDGDPEDWFRLAGRSGSYDNTDAIYDDETTVDPGVVYDDGMTGLAAPKRYRERLQCPVCREPTPAREEKLRAVLARFYDTGNNEISLSVLGRALSALGRTRPTP